MMALAENHGRLLERLPPVRGRLTEGAPLGRSTWFRVGGPAEVLFRPADVDDLAAFLVAKPADVPVTAIGVGSNLLVRDGGVAGVVVRLGGPFALIGVEGDRVRAGAGALDLNVARTALEADLTGLEFLSGIPGTVGGALRMNAGAYGREVKDTVVSAEALDPQGARRALTCDDMAFSYRGCAVPEDWIFTAALFQATAGDHTAIARRMEEIAATRGATQPLRTATGGSTFKNPTGRKAWELIEAAGCRGLRRGGAMVAEKHCNFLVNTGGATAADLESLGEEIRRRVLEREGVRLEWEIRRIGRPSSVTGGPTQ